MTTDAGPMAEHVQRRWRDGEAPDGDVIVFGDGRLSVMRFWATDSWARADEVLRATEWTVGHWLDVDVVMASCGYAGYRAYGGESAAHGSIGWVALTRDDEQRTLEWLAVCSESNPFAEVTLDDACLTAVSTSHQLWTFPRDAPQKVEIRRMAERDR
ncbi:hypothetical protein [Streptomyces sp. RTd22]|uniref:hypothetical protein n=1 Tax=Streptomyces sp. RTd22 TaxID=1841249 RepID=UPI000A924D8B|nr:hypothetical protein [Streptomyces sp. RTd22]